MMIRRGHAYIVDFNPQIRTKPGKLRPAVVLQSDLVTEAGYPSTIVIPATTKVIEDPGMLRMRISAGAAGFEKDSDLLLGQLIAVANESFRFEIGALGEEAMEEIDRRVRVILAL